MIKSFALRDRASLKIMQVVDVYVINGIPECDLLDFSGILYEGCSVMSLGGGSTDRMSTPAVDAEVLTIQQGRGAPYILGVLAAEQNYEEQDPALNEAGEYPPLKIGLDHSELKSAGSRVVTGSSAVYVEPRMRVQGIFEVSAGSSPDQHLTVAEPLISTLEAYQLRMQEMKGALEELQSTVNSLIDALSLDLPLGAPTNLSLVPRPSASIETIDPPDGRMISQIAKIER